MNFGPEITRGSVAWRADETRPGWLSNDVPMRATDRWGVTYGSLAGEGGHVWQSKELPGNPIWRAVGAIMIPADHSAYKAIGAGMRPWSGGDEAPGDWDGGEVLFECGQAWVPDPGSFKDSELIIGYTPRATPAPTTEDPAEAAIALVREIARYGATRSSTLEECGWSVEARRIAALPGFPAEVDADVVAVRELLTGYGYAVQDDAARSIADYFRKGG